MRVRSHWRVCLLLLAFGVLGGRLAWSLKGSMTGWRPHLHQWVNVGESLIGIETIPLSDKAPKEQAGFWLEEVSRVEVANTDSQVAMGSAWMLDAPQFGFISRHVGVNQDADFPGLPLSARWEIDFEAIAALSSEFEASCQEECLARVETAIRLDADNVELWRARALLTFRKQVMGFGLEPRRDDWLSVLDECAEHEPDNALYDYLAALQLCISSANYDFQDEGYVLDIQDPTTFDQGVGRLHAGLAKPHLRFGTDHYAATLAFLDQSSIAPIDHVTAAGSRLIDGRATDLLYRIMRWQAVQRDIAKKNGDFNAAMTAVQPVLRISDQITEAGNPVGLITPKLILRQWGLASLNNLNEADPTLMDAEQTERIAAEYGAAQLDVRMLETIGERLKEKTVAVDAPQLLSSALLMVTAQMFVVLSVCIASLPVIAMLVCGASNDESPTEMRLSRHLIAWLVGIGVSFALLGAVAAWMSPTVWSAAEGLRLTPDELRSSMDLQDSWWTWAFIQWQAHHGVLVASLLAAAVLIVWHLIRRGDRIEGGVWEIIRSGKRSHARHAAAVVVQSSMMALLVFLLIYLAVTPAVARSLETYHREHRARLVNPEYAWNEIHAAQAQIQSDESLMTLLRSEVAEHNRQVAEQRGWTEE